MAIPATVCLLAITRASNVRLGRQARLVVPVVVCIASASYAMRDTRGRIRARRAKFLSLNRPRAMHGQYPWRLVSRWIGRRTGYGSGGLQVRSEPRLLSVFRERRLSAVSGKSDYSTAICVSSSGSGSGCRHYSHRSSSSLKSRLPDVIDTGRH